MRLCYSLTWFWYLTGYGAESRRWLEQASRAASVARGPELPQLLNALGLLQLQQGQRGGLAGRARQGAGAVAGGR